MDTLWNPPTNAVFYSCKNADCPDGIYESIETGLAESGIGISQIRIKRTVINKTMLISILESAEYEIAEYISRSSIKPVPVNNYAQEIPDEFSQDPIN